MIERAFEEARLHKGNKRNAVRPFAITQARQLLEAAGVVDPVIRDQSIATKPQIAVERAFYMIPEGAGVRFSLDIGGKSPKQLEAENKAIREVTIDASDMIHSSKFEVLEGVTAQELLKAPVSAFGLPGNPTTTKIVERIPQCQYGEYALELPRAEVGPHLGIADKDQAKDDYYYVMHQPIGLPRVFYWVVHAYGGRFLDSLSANPGLRWTPDIRLVVALRKIEPVKA